MAARYDPSTARTAPAIPCLAYPDLSSVHPPSSCPDSSWLHLHVAAVEPCPERVAGIASVDCVDRKARRIERPSVRVRLQQQEDRAHVVERPALPRRCDPG